MAAAKILLVEDEKNLAFSLKLNLVAEGLTVIHAATGLQAIAAFERERPLAGVILDIMLPDLDGFEVAKRIRALDPRVGITMLTAKASEEDRLHGLDVGADDYIIKPFHLAEFLKRVKRMVARSQFFEGAPAPQRLSFGAVTLEEDTLTLLSPRGTFQLTALEADVMRAFLLKPNQILSRGFLLKEVWGVAESLETRTVDNFIVRLRRFLEPNPRKPQILLSVRGKGYLLKSFHEPQGNDHGD